MVTTIIYDYTRTTQLNHLRFGTDPAQYMGNTLQLSKIAKFEAENKNLLSRQADLVTKSVPYVTISMFTSKL